MAIDSIKNKKGTVWRARLILKSGKRVSKCFKRKVDAEQWEVHLRFENENPAQPKRPPISFTELANRVLEYSKPELQPATYQRYESVIRNYLIPEFGTADVGSISKRDVTDFRYKVVSLPISQATKYFIFCSLKTLIRRGREIDLIDCDPTMGVKAPKKGIARTEYWTLSEIQNFLDSMKDHPRFGLYMIALNTGMRSAEIFGLKWDCVDFEHSLIHVKRTLDQKTQILKETTKTHTQRSVGISDSLLKLFRKLYSEKKSEFVLDRADIGCKDTSHLARAFKKDCERVGIRPIKFHDLRHTFATQLVRKSGDIHAVANVMGHKSATMTERYAHFGSEHAVQVARLIAFDAANETNVIPIRAVK